MDRAVEPADGTVLSFPGDMSGREKPSADADLPRAVLLSGTGPSTRKDLVKQKARASTARAFSAYPPWDSNPEPAD